VNSIVRKQFQEGKRDTYMKSASASTSESRSPMSTSKPGPISETIRPSTWPQTPLGLLEVLHHQYRPFIKAASKLGM